jgi:hypothetical protein
VYQGVYLNPEKTKLGLEKSGESAVDEWDGNNNLYTG